MITCIVYIEKPEKIHLKILLIHNRYSQVGGEDSIFLRECRLLESKGHSVRSLLFDNRKAFEGSFLKKIRIGFGSIFNIESSHLVGKYIEDFQPDVIHVHNMFYVASPSILFAAHKYKVPVVVTLHNYRLICSSALLMRDSKPCEVCISRAFPIAGVQYACHRNSRLETAQLTFTTGLHKTIGTWLNKVNTYIALTDFAKNKFINSSLDLPAEMVVVKANSVDDPGFGSIEEREDHFVFVGRLSKEKGIEVLLDAFDNTTCKIEIIGDGPYDGLVKKVASRNKNIKYWGFRDQQFIRNRLSKAIALIVPSICYEGLPTAVLESFACGTPIIISDIDNLRELVSRNFNGVHFKTGNSTNLSEVVQDFLDNRHRLIELYENSRETYLERYTHEINYRNLVKVYQSAILKHQNMYPELSNDT